MTTFIAETPSSSVPVEPLAVLLFGAPGSGKGSVARVLRQLTGWPHISSGDLLRERNSSDDAGSRGLRQQLAQGYLAPDDTVLRMVESRLRMPDCRHGVLLDGFPRTLQQAAALAGWLRPLGLTPITVVLRVDYNEMMRRLSGRRICPACGAIFNTQTQPPRQEGRCDSDGAPLFVREEDGPDAIARRLDTYARLTAPVESFLGSVSVTRYEIEAADGAPAEIAARVFSTIAAPQVQTNTALAR